MKNTIKLVAMLTVAVAMSCNSALESEEPIAPSGLPATSYIHILYLSFQDASGNDLVKGIEFNAWDRINGVEITGREEDMGGAVKPELYSLEYVYEDRNQDPSKQRHSGNHPITALNKGVGLNEAYPEVNSAYDYLQFYTHSTNSLYYEIFEGRNVKVPFAENITIKLKCHYLFGDNVVHEIVTLWEKPTIGVYSKCYRIKFGGKEFTEIIYENYNQYSIATVILEK